MIKLKSIKERNFSSLVGPSGSGKPHHIFDCLKIGTFPPAFDKAFFTFINIINVFVVKCREKNPIIQKHHNLHCTKTLLGLILR